jgi:hypothetical protein
LPQSKTKIEKEDFACRHPIFSVENTSLGVKMVRKVIQSALEQLQKKQSCTNKLSAFKLIRKKARELQQNFDWRVVTITKGDTPFDPRVSFVLKIMSILANMTRIRPLYIKESDFRTAQQVFENIVSNILDLLEKLITRDTYRFAESSQIYPSVIEPLSVNLSSIYAIFGLDFAQLSNCLPIPKTTLLHRPQIDSPCAATIPKYRIIVSLWLRWSRKYLVGAKLNMLKGNDEISWKQNRFSEACNTFEDMRQIVSTCDFSEPKDDYESNEEIKNRYKLAESGFWNCFEIINKGDISLLAGVLCAIEDAIDLSKVDRIVPIARGGLVLGSLVSLGARYTDLPLSIMSIYPFLKMEPLPTKRENLLVVDSSLHSGFTLRTIANKMGPYLALLKPKIKHYLVGLAPEKLDLPFTEPEFYDIQNKLVKLASCPDEQELNNTYEQPNTNDSQLLNELTTRKGNKMLTRYATYLQRRFGIDGYKARGLEVLGRDIFEKSKIRHSLTASVKIPNETQRAQVIRIGGFFENPEYIVTLSREIYFMLVQGGIIPNSIPSDGGQDKLIVIIGGRNAVPFGIGLGIFESVNRENTSSKAEPRIWMTLARRMGTFLPYIEKSPLYRNRKILILDTMIKNGLVIQNIIESIRRKLLTPSANANQNASTLSLGVLSLVAPVGSLDPSRDGSIEKYLRDIQKMDTSSGRSIPQIKPLWNEQADGNFVRVLYSLSNESRIITNSIT